MNDCEVCMGAMIQAHLLMEFKIMQKHLTELLSEEAKCAII